MQRDNFNKPLIDNLARRVGLRCSNLDCRQQTAGPADDLTRAVNIGVAAHITAAAEGGPRYDASLTTEQRASIDNAIWLFQNCAKLIDSDPRRFTVDVLRGWKVRAEMV